MTAEIAIANKTALALAADSKVTIGSSRNAKTYDSVNKVFTLSKSCPVGIMIFGSAEFMGYPWETIIKLYRRKRGGEEKGFIKDWSEDFQLYLQKFGKIEPRHKKGNVKSIVLLWLFQIEVLAQERAAISNTMYPSDEYNSILLETINRQINRLESTEVWLPDAKAKSFLKNYGDAIFEAVQEALGVADGDELFNAAVKLAVSVLLKNVDSPQSSGFVIGGFGSREYFPTVIEHNTDGFVGDNLKLRPNSPNDISRDMPGYVGAFAQKDMVQNFMNGFDSDLIHKMTGGFNEILIDSCLAVLDTYGLKNKKTDKIRNEVKKAAHARVMKLVQAFADESRERFSGPVVDMVSVLPKEELAHLAESLVALTSLRRRVSREVETVGGPIDVALISKGDGFVWIKRKHYFRAELNPQFVRNYMDDVR